MRVRGIDFDVLYNLATSLDMVIRNERQIGKFYGFKLSPKSSQTYYSRKSQSGRRVKALCFHGWRDFIRAVLSHGANCVTSTMGRWTSIEEFNADLPRIKGINVGSMLHPMLMSELCTHEGTLPPLLRRAQEISRRETRTSEAVA